jgi:hypothetical protein
MIPDRSSESNAVWRRSNDVVRFDGIRDAFSLPQRRATCSLDAISSNDSKP